MYALVMDGCDSVDIAEDIDTLLAQYTDKEVKAVLNYGIYYEVYAKMNIVIILFLQVIIYLKQ